MRSLIGHLDADCFYCSAERVRYRGLNGLPIGVLGNQGACVIAKSYEAKAKGIKTGDPIWDAVKLVPNMVFIKRDFRWYEVLSRKMLAVVRSFSPRVEFYSIDEFFFDATGFKNVVSDSQALQKTILDDVGVPVTIGISLSRSLAKLISDDAKPFGCKILLEEIPDFLTKLPVDAITGIGRRSSEKLRAKGIHNCFEFTRAERSFIRKMLTVRGEKLWFELQGEPCDPIQAVRKPHKAISRGGSLGGKTDDRKILNGWVVRNAERLIEELDYHQVFTERIVLILVGEEHSWAAKDDMGPNATFHVLVSALKRLLGHAPTFVVSHMHVIAEKLTFRSCVQKTLFPYEDDPIANVKAEINSQVGRFALRSGDTLSLPAIYKDTTNEFDICDIRDKTCF
jgi:nucleotidyltransferase/DNA polymerase involved in DNA repair